MKKIIFIGLFFLITFYSYGSVSDKNNHKETKTEIVRKAVENRKYKINASFVIPSSMPSRYLTGSYSLAVCNDSTFIDLPYFGVGYSVPYGGENGIKYKGIYQNYKLTYNHRKQRYTIRFEIKTQYDGYNISLDIWSNGKTNIYILPLNKRSISFTGELDN